jgi:hypothetical protein
MFNPIFKKISSKILSWFSKQVPIPEQRGPQVYQLADHDPGYEPDKVRPTKAYADERQKAPHNRRRKPSKAMRHLYQLG